MFEASSTRETYNAMQRAHEERAQAMKDAWNWLFSGNKTR
jgi:hypothetical protein